MNIQIPDSWLRDFLKTQATPQQIQEALSLCSVSVEKIQKSGTDFVYDIEVTTNRVDLMSILGIAKEAAAVLPQFGHSAKLIKNPLKQKVSLRSSRSVNYLSVKMDAKLCPHFSTILIQNTTISASPPWLVKRLEMVGMRSLNNVVDISNYLMHELGQPIHTFDYDKISGHKMILRESKKGEVVTTLDHVTRVLPGHDIVIEDGSGKLIDLCGIMGGLNSAVDQNTKNVLLFVQTYAPVYIRKTSMSLAHRTGAAVLFEKGLPPENVLPVIQEGMLLFEKLTGGKPHPTALSLTIPPTPTPTIKLTKNLPELVSVLLGTSLNFTQIKNILSRLDFIVLSQREVVVPPARRLDVTLPEDLVEEVARVYGYHNLPSRLMAGELPLSQNDHGFIWEQKIKSFLTNLGFTELYSYSLVAKHLETNPRALKLKNPLTLEWEYLRTEITPSLRKTITENLGRAGKLDLFEIANVYLPQKNNLPKERLHLAIASTYKDYFSIKGIIEAIYSQMGIDSGNIPIAIDQIESVLSVEIDLTDLLSHATTVKTYTPISKFSPIVEDVNFTIQPEQTYADLVKKIKSLSNLIQEVKLIDKYASRITLRLTYHDNLKQLKSTDLESLREKLLRIQTP